MLLLLTMMAAAAPASASGPGDPKCITTASPASLAKRASPLDSVTFKVGSTLVKVCYGRPSARGRTMIGGYNVPFGKVWRTGANEPTMIHTTGPLVVAGIRLASGSYSLYTIPGETEWVVILNRSIEQWGDEGSYNDEKVRVQEVGRAAVKHQSLGQHLEQLTLRPEPGKAGGVGLVLEWETSRIVIPIQAAEG